MAAGARDVVSLAHRGRLQAVVERELRARRLQAALDGVLSSATQYKQELRNLMKGATEAIVDVQEGIVISANPAWLGMFGLEQEQRTGRPAVHGPVLRQGPAEPEGCRAGLPEGQVDGQHACRSPPSAATTPPSAWSCKPRARDRGRRAGRACHRARRDAPAKRRTEDLVEQALWKDPSTGFLLRHHFLEQMEQRLQQPVAGGRTGRGLHSSRITSPACIATSGCSAPRR